MRSRPMVVVEQVADFWDRGASACSGRRWFASPRLSVHHKGFNSNHSSSQLAHQAGHGCRSVSARSWLVALVGPVTVVEDRQGVAWRTPDRRRTS
jgi:hypothetical protein